MIKKYELIVGIFLILLILPSLVKADDSIYSKSDNIIRINTDYKIVNTEKIISDILIDNNSIYYFSNKNLYFVNKSNGIINYKISILGIKNLTQSDNYVFVNTNYDIYKINKFTGIIETKYRLSFIDGIYSFFTMFPISNNLFLNIVGNGNLWGTTRNIDTIYYNNNSNAIMISISGYYTSNTDNVNPKFDLRYNFIKDEIVSDSILRVNYDVSPNVDQSSFIFVNIIPSGSSYQLKKDYEDFGTINIATWYENEFKINKN